MTIFSLFIWCMKFVCLLQIIASCVALLIAYCLRNHAKFLMTVGTLPSTDFLSTFIARSLKLSHKIPAFDCHINIFHTYFFLTTSILLLHQLKQFNKSLSRNFTQMQIYIYIYLTIRCTKRLFLCLRRVHAKSQFNTSLQVEIKLNEINSRWIY